MDNLSWGNPVAHRVRVHFNTASAVIYEGMPVCYNYDTTVNWAGGSVSDGAVTASTTLTAGTPETAAAKYLEVENPADGNIQWFAGVVAKGGWCGKTTSATAGVGQLLDIYVPNGAIVPVRAGIGCTAGRTVLSVIAATQYLGHSLSATEARPVAIVEETVDRSTAGLILAKLDPNLFIYQDSTGSALLVGTGATAAAASQVVNRINVSSAQTAGRFTALDIQAAVTSTCVGTGYGIALYTQTDISGILGGQSAGVSHWTNINAGGDLTHEYYALEVGIYESGADLRGNQRISPLVLRTQLDGTNACSDGHYMMTFICDGTGDHPDGLFSTNEVEDIAMTEITGSNTNCIPFNVGPPGAETTYWIMVTNAAT